MTQTEMLSRVRAVLKETSAGYFLDTELYDFIDSGQNRVIQLGLAKEAVARSVGRFYYSPVLTPLITLDTLNTTSTGSGLIEYAVPSDFLAINYAEYSYTTPAVRYPCAVVDFATANKRGANFYGNSFKSPLVYIRAEKIGFFPQPIGGVALGYQHYYYKQPAVVTSSQDFTLREEAHEAIEEWALYQALQEAKEYDKASVHLNNFIMTISELC